MAASPATRRLPAAPHCSLQARRDKSSAAYFGCTRHAHSGPTVECLPPATAVPTVDGRLQPVCRSLPTRRALATSRPLGPERASAPLRRASALVSPDAAALSTVRIVHRCAPSTPPCWHPPISGSRSTLPHMQPSALTRDRVRPYELACAQPLPVPIPPPTAPCSRCNCSPPIALSRGAASLVAPPLL